MVDESERWREVGDKPPVVTGYAMTEKRVGFARDADERTTRVLLLPAVSVARISPDFVGATGPSGCITSAPISGTKRGPSLPSG